MAGYQYHGQPLGHEQYAEWRASVHGRALMDKGDLGAPTCNNCHGNHGAVPPAVGSVANACGACHGKIADLFADTRMKHRFVEEKLPGCATCHGSHAIHPPSDEMVGMQGGAVCVTCHAGGKYGATLAGANAARTIRHGLDELTQEIAHAQATVAEAERLGMEVSGPRFDLRNAQSALTNARTLLHSFQLKPVDGGAGRWPKRRHEGPRARPIRPWRNTPPGGYGLPPHSCPSSSLSACFFSTSARCPPSRCRLPIRFDTSVATCYSPPPPIGRGSGLPSNHGPPR